MNLRKRVEQLEGERGGGDEWFEIEHGDGRVEVITGPRGLILGMLHDAQTGRIPERFRDCSVLRQSDGGGLIELALSIAFSPCDPGAEPPAAQVVM